MVGIEKGELSNRQAARKNTEAWLGMADHGCVRGNDCLWYEMSGNGLLVEIMSGCGDIVKWRYPVLTKKRDGNVNRLALSRQPQHCSRFESAPLHDISPCSLTINRSEPTHQDVIAVPPLQRCHFAFRRPLYTLGLRQKFYLLRL